MDDCRIQNKVQAWSSLHANYCNQTQVFIILHLTYLLTAHLPMLSPAADFAEPRPPRHNGILAKYVNI